MFRLLQTPFRRSSAVLLSIVGLTGALLLGVSLSAAPRPGQKAPEKGATSAQKFKNIKVLKTLPADQLIPVMHKFNISLGVKCDYCHVVGPNHTGFEKDDKPAKNKAREMLLMSEDINKRYKTVDKQVTCYTCHHGNAVPEKMAEPDKK